MNFILLSGGEGKRLWPASGPSKPKQFLKFFNSQDGNPENLIQRLYRQLSAFDKDLKLVFATNASQVEMLKACMNNNVEISVEPSRRNTFPAVVLASYYLRDCLGVAEDQAVAVCPSDAFVEKPYFELIEQMYTDVENSKYNMCVMGIKPTIPNSQYGYILPESTNQFPAKVVQFSEKPSIDNAKTYIDKGGLWNCGVFVFKLKYFLNLVHNIIYCDNYEDVQHNFDKLPNISFDKAVLEKEQNLQVYKYDGIWNDIGTWNNLSDVLENKNVGENITEENCDNTFIYNGTNLPIVASGLKDLVVSVSENGILVFHKNDAQNINHFLDSNINN